MNFKEFIEGMDTSMVGDLSQTFSNSDGDFEEKGVVSKYFTKKLPSEDSSFKPEETYGKKFQKLRRKKRK